MCNALRIGWAQIDITPGCPVSNIGQIYPRVSKYVHSRLYATALAMESGETQTILLSLDLLCPPGGTVLRQVRENLRAEGIRPESVIVCATHTHNAYLPDEGLWADCPDIPARYRSIADAPVNLLTVQAAETLLIARMTEAARTAWQRRAPGGISTAHEYAAIGFNRRPVFHGPSGEKTVMYGDCSDNAFIRFEGGTDPSADMLYTWSAEGRLTGVAVCIPCPAQVYELHPLISSDYWGYARDAIRERLGGIPVLPLCGAAGDQTPLDLTHISRTNREPLRQWAAQAGEVHRNLDMSDTCRSIAGRIGDAVLRGMQSARSAIETSPIFLHEYAQLTLPLITVTQDECEQAKASLDALLSSLGSNETLSGAQLVEAYEPAGILRRWRLQQQGDTIRTPTHFLRIGHCAIATNPFELFTDYALRIKAQAASPQTIVVQLADAYFQYLPTASAVRGGSYSSKVASCLCGPESGDCLVLETVAGIGRLWSA